MQIRRIVLYNHVGRIRELPFKPGRVNILSGPSERGKSAILAVVDYCLGAKRLGVPAGVIQDTVKWYGLELDFQGEPLFVARPGVSAARRASPSWHIGRGRDGDPPGLDELSPTFSRDELLEKINTRLEIGPALLPRSDGSVDRKKLTFRSSLIYCFQKQNEIANPDLFFHRQGETGIAQTIRDTLPFYLGAISENMIALQEQLKLERRRLRDAEKRLDRMLTVGARRDEEATYLLDEARRTGLLADPVGDGLSIEESFGLLQQADAAAVSSADRPGEDVIAAIGRELSVLQQRRNDLRKQIEAMEEFGRDQDLVESGVNEQQRRLHSLHLFPDSLQSSDICPICESILESPSPAAGDLNRSLQTLEAELEFVSQDRAELVEAIAHRRTDLANTEDEIAAVRRRLSRLREENENARALLEQRNKMARVGGMINMFLRVSGEQGGEDRPSLEAEAIALRQSIQALEEETDLTAVRSRTATFLGGVGQMITSWARKQNLDYASGLLTFDVRGPQLVSETEAGTIPFSRFGSGKNWVWYHLLGHMALHRWFSEKRRPTPRFIVLDQPSQVYFPSGHPEEGERDIEEVRRIYEWLIATTAAFDGDMQVIVTDHARFPDDPQFVEHLEYDWWASGDTLIPPDWIESN